MLKHTIDSRKGWVVDFESRPETIKYLLPGVPAMALMNYPEHMMGTKVIGEYVTVRAENKYTGKVIEMDNPPNWKIVQVYDEETHEFKYATFSWESE